MLASIFYAKMSRAKSLHLHRDILYFHYAIDTQWKASSLHLKVKAIQPYDIRDLRDAQRRTKE
jgi:hypothetical protein